jgi:hypothetical protein
MVDNATAGMLSSDRAMSLIINISTTMSASRDWEYISLQCHGVDKMERPLPNNGAARPS